VRTPSRSQPNYLRGHIILCKLLPPDAFSPGIDGNFRLPIGGGKRVGWLIGLFCGGNPGKKMGFSKWKDPLYEVHALSTS